MMVKIGSAAIALLILGLQPGLGLAQSDDDETPAPVPAPVAPAPRSSMDQYQLFHRHAGGDDDERPRGLLRGDPKEVTRLESTSGTGLAMDRSPLPGDLGGSPEASRPLFEKPATSLAIRPDPWALQPK